MTADRRHKKCQPRTVQQFKEQLTELKKWIGHTQPPAHFEDDWFAGLCAEPSQFTEQMIKLREALQAAGQPADAEAVPQPVRVHRLP
jgi:hypothetical protein